MKLFATTFISLFVLFVTGCIPSLNPLYTEADLIMDPTLVGSWEEKGTGEVWTFSNSDKLKYSLVHTDAHGRKGEYDARLVRLEDKLFLDIVPVKPGFSQNDLYRERFIATHTFIHVIRKDSTVEIAYMESRWLKEYLAEHPNEIRHEKVNGEIVLTSSPKETQKFVLAHLATRNAFSDSTEMIRKRGGS